MDKEYATEVKKGRQQFRRKAHEQRTVVRIVVVVPVVVVSVNATTINIEPACIAQALTDPPPFERLRGSHG